MPPIEIPNVKVEVSLAVIKEFQPDWTDEQCWDWLKANQNFIEDRLWDVVAEEIGAMMEFDEEAKEA